MSFHPFRNIEVHTQGLFLHFAMCHLLQRCATCERTRLLEAAFFVTPKQQAGDLRKSKATAPGGRPACCQAHTPASRLTGHVPASGHHCQASRKACIMSVSPSAASPAVISLNLYKFAAYSVCTAALSNKTRFPSPPQHKHSHGNHNEDKGPAGPRRRGRKQEAAPSPRPPLPCQPPLPLPKPKHRGSLCPFRDLFAPTPHCRAGRRWHLGRRLAFRGSSGYEGAAPCWPFPPYHFFLPRHPPSQRTTPCAPAHKLRALGPVNRSRRR